MATHEEELKQINADIELIEAEIASNEEWVDSLNPLDDTYKRKRYLHLRNKYLQEKLSKLKEQQKSKLEVIDWERRTR